MHGPDALNAFCGHGRDEIQTSDTGPLAGLTFAVKDAFDVAGVATGAGSPEWLSSHPVPRQTAQVLVRLLNAGARLIGKTHLDELAWSLDGENAHYGTPVNPAAPQRIPGGSSSGSASVTAAGIVDFAIGTDTGGSTRLPASFCGIYGMRPTHGRIPLHGVVPLAPSYDCVGWFARDAAMMARVGEVLLGSVRPPRPCRKLLISRDLFDVAGHATRDALQPALDRLATQVGAVEIIDLAGSDLEAWCEAFRLIQAAEVWDVHGEWVRRTKPALGPGIRERFAAAATVDRVKLAAARGLRERIGAGMTETLTDGAVLVLPTTPGIAPLRNSPAAEREAHRARALKLLCPAGHAGMPQISLPLGTLEGCPLGLSLMAGRGRDEELLALAAAL